MALSDAGSNTARPQLHLLVAADDLPSARYLPQICAGLDFAELRVIWCPKSMEYFEIPPLGRGFRLYIDHGPGHSITLHSELATWAQALLVVPVSSNTLAKMALGLCDTLLTRVVKSWEYPSDEKECQRPGKKMFLFPEMDLGMWLNSTTMCHINKLTKLGATVDLETRSPDQIVTEVRKNLL